MIEGEKGVFFVRYDRSGQPVAQNVNVQKSTSTVDGATLMKVIKATELKMKKPVVDGIKRGGRRPRGGCPMITLLL